MHSSNTSLPTTAERRTTKHAFMSGETQEFGNHGIPVGTYKLDPLPKRFVTGTIEPNSQSIAYTVQDIDKHFVQVNTHKSYAVVSGNT